jgi:hypothetical protein
MAFDPSTATEFDPSSAVEVTAGFDPSSAAEIPTVPDAPTRSAYEPGVLENATGAITEPLMKMGSSLIAKPVSEVMGISAMFADYLGGMKGDPRGFQKSMQDAMTYEPRTVAGASKYNPLNAIPDLIGRGVSAVTTPVMGALRGDDSADSVRGGAVNALGEAVPQALGMIGVKNAPLISKGVRNVATDTVADATKSMAFSKQAAREAASTADWQRAASIEAAKAARSEKIILNPSSVSETTRPLRMAAAGGSAHFNTAASIANKSKWNDMVRSDLGLPLTGELSQLTAKNYDGVRKIVGKPYDQAASLGKLSPNADILAAIREIDIPEILPAGEIAAGKMARTTDYVTNQIENGMTGKMAVDTTKTLRREAKQVFESVRSGNRVPSIEIDAAKAKMRMADKVDELISSNISDPKWKSAFDDSRRKMALTYAYERATNLVTRQIDPQVFAQEMQGRHFLTGNAKKMGEIAANYPEIANVYAERGTTFAMPVRSGAAGTTGFAIGSLYGAPVATSATMATVSALGEKVYGKRLRSEAAQSKLATPVDRRIMPTPEAPTFSMGRGQASDAPVLPKLQLGYTPSPVKELPVQKGAPVAPSDVTNVVRVPNAVSAERFAEQTANVSKSKTRDLRGTSNAPGSGMMYDLDPVTGKLVAADRGIKGATPEIWQADTGANLRSASEKVASGKTFDMTAAEKVAWSKTAVDIKSVIPEFSKLTEKQITAKMADRQWVQSTIDKVNQQVEMFAQLEKRSQDRLAQSLARIQREKMMDIAEQLQDALGSRPSSRGYTQGAKTRDFQRGLLTDLGDPK